MIRSGQAAPDAIGLECKHCHELLVESQPGPSRVRYFRCPSCGRWSSSMYATEMKREAGVQPRRPEPQQDPKFEQVKDRLEAWLAHLEQRDPLSVLGLPFRATPEQIRERYRQLASQHHPDHGGDPARMREVNEAYALLRARKK